MEDSWQQHVAQDDWETWQLFAKMHAAKEARRRGPCRHGKQQTREGSR